MNLVWIPIIACGLMLLLIISYVDLFYTAKPIKKKRYDPFENIRHYYKDGVMPHEIKMAAEEEALRIQYKIYEESSK